MTKFLHFNNPDFAKMSIRLRKKYQSRTVAAEPATPEAIRALAVDFVTTDPEDQMLIYKLRVGVTVLHPNDRYEKKAGREYAVARMEDVPVQVTGVQVTPTHIFIRLQPVKGVSLNLRLNKKSNFSTITGSLSGDE